MNPHVQKRLRVPLPLELTLVIAGTIVSVVLDLNKRYGVHIVKTVPRGLVVQSLNCS